MSVAIITVSLPCALLVSRSRRRFLPLLFDFSAWLDCVLHGDYTGCRMNYVHALSGAAMIPSVQTTCKC